MNALKGRVSSDLDDLVNRTDSPFTTQVNSCPLPQKFRMPQVESYDGVKDPLDHLETFKTLMHLQGAKCPIHLALHRGAQVQEVYSMLNEHQAAGGRDAAIIQNSLQHGSTFH